MTRKHLKLAYLGLSTLLFLPSVAVADDCLFVNGNRPSPTSENEVHAFQIQVAAVPVEIEGSPFASGGLGGLHRATRSLVARGDRLWVLNSGSSFHTGSVAEFRIAEDCSLEFRHLSDPTPGSSFAMEIDRSGRFLYVTNPEERSISIFQRDESERWRLMGNEATPDTPLDIVQDPLSGMIYVIFRNTPGFGYYRPLAHGGLELVDVQVWLHSGLLLPPSGRTLFTFWSRFNGGLNVLSLDEQGVPTLETGSPWPGPVGVADMVYAESLSLLVTVSDTLLELGAFDVDGVRIEERPFSPVSGLRPVTRGLALDQNLQLYVLSPRQLRTFSVSRDAIEPIEPTLWLPNAAKAGMLVHPAPRPPVAEIPAATSPGLVVLSIVLALAALTVLARRR